jgi:hypothetical protein
MMKMSFSGSDSEQYLNVESPGIGGLEATSVAINGLWCLKGVHVTVKLRTFVRMRR